MANNLQFLDDPDDVPFINENITLHVGVYGSDDFGNGSAEEPFRTLGKAVDVVKNKMIGIDKIVTIQMGDILSTLDGTGKKYFEEEPISIDFENAKRLKIKGTKPTDHEVVAISYYDKATDRDDGYYCQILVTNQDKIKIGDYIGVYDHLKIKKANPSYFWVRNNIFSSLTRMVTTNNCYVEAIRSDMILGVHEVVDIGPVLEHDGNYLGLATELFEGEGLKIGTVTLYVKNNNFTYKRLEEVPYWNSLGRKNNEPIYTYAAGAGNSPIEAQQNNFLPPVLYGAELVANPKTIENGEVEQFYYSNPVQQIELVDIMIRGYQFGIRDLDNTIFDPRTGNLVKDATLLWNDKKLTGSDRLVVCSPIASYFYKKIISDLRIDLDLPFYFGKSSDPYIPTKSVVKAAKKVRDFLLAGARQLKSVPTWDEDNHPGYGFGPFDSGAVRPPTGGGAEVDKTSYPSEYADETKFSWLLRYYNIFPPINGQLYQPTLLKRIKSWYNDNATTNGLQLDRWEKKGNKSPFFCGYITPQGWYKQNYTTTPSGSGGAVIPSLTDLTDLNGYHRIFSGRYPTYVGNDTTSFKGVSNGSYGSFSNEREATKNQYFIDISNYYFETAGLTSGTSLGNTSSYATKGSMGSVWYSGSVNSFKLSAEENSGRNLSAIGAFVFDRYSFGFQQDSNIPSNDEIITKNVGLPTVQTIAPLTSPQTMNIRAKCYKSVLRFSGDGIRITKKSKLGLIKDVCIVNLGLGNSETKRTYGLLAENESVVNASNIAVSSFSCGIAAKGQSLVNLLADLGNSDNVYHKNMFNAIDPAAIVTANGIGIESTTKSHVNAQRTVSSGSATANYAAIASSSIDCSNSISTSGFKHGYVCDFNSYMKAMNTFSEFNGGVGYVVANNSLLVCHRSRSLWNGYHGLLATNKATAKCYEFVSRSNDGDGVLAQNKSVVSCGANSSKWANYRKEIVGSGYILDPTNPGDNFGLYTMLPPNLFQVTVVQPRDPNFTIPLPSPAVGINSNPTHGLNVLYHECNSTIAEFNSGSGFASETDSLIVADNTIARYNSKKYGEFFIYGWSGIKGSFPTDTFTPNERSI